MNINIYNAITAILEADASLTTNDKEKILAVCRHPTEFTKPEERKFPQLISIKMASKIMNVSRITIWRMTQEGRLPAIRFRTQGSPRYDLNDIWALIEKEKKEAVGGPTEGSSDNSEKHQ